MSVKHCFVLFFELYLKKNILIASSTKCTHGSTRGNLHTSPSPIFPSLPISQATHHNHCNPRLLWTLSQIRLKPPAKRCLPTCQVKSCSIYICIYMYIHTYTILFSNGSTKYCNNKMCQHQTICSGCFQLFRWEFCYPHPANLTWYPPRWVSQKHDSDSKLPEVPSFLLSVLLTKRFDQGFFGETSQKSSSKKRRKQKTPEYAEK